MEWKTYKTIDKTIKNNRLNNYLRDNRYNNTK